MSSTLHEVDVLRCYGSFGSVDKWHGFEFRVYADGTLTASMERALKHAWRDSEYFEDDDEEVDDIDWSIDEDEDIMEENQPSWARERPRQENNEDTGAYEVEFMIGSWSPGDEHGESMLCFGNLTTKGLVGHFQLLNDEGEAEEEPTPLEIKTRDEDSCFEERLQMPCAPLSSGIFHFSCSSVSDKAELYDGHANVELHPDGSVSGEIRESLGWSHYKPAKVTGTWSPELVRFTMTRSQRSGQECTYTCIPSVAGLRGTWRTEAFVPDNANFESGTFSFKLDRCQRRAWNEAVHSFFPPVFFESARWLLLSSLRVSAESPSLVIPSSLWSRVLCYTEQDWFKAGKKTNATKKRAHQHSGDEEKATKRRVGSKWTQLHTIRQSLTETSAQYE